MEALIILIFFVALAMAARHWGADSRDGVNSREWHCRWLRGNFV
jgi:hypothetical protein